MDGVQIKIPEGVAALIANAHKPMPVGKNPIFFRGDLEQMSNAVSAAHQLGIEVGVAGGIPYVTSEDDLAKVVKYLVTNQINGYQNYK